MEKKRKKLLSGLAIALASLLLLVAVFFGYVGNYYHADEVAISACTSDHGVVVTEEKDDILFMPSSPVAGLVFYPGGKVEAAAYAPLMKKLAESGIACVLLKLNFNLAVLDMNAADGVTKRFPEIGTWSIGGHSLGGVAASSFAAAHTNDFSDVLLLASYSTTSLKGLRVTCVYGSEDQVMKRDNYEDGKKNLFDLHEKIVQGGNHAGFASYGEQKGDGKATITTEEQVSQTAEYFLSVFLGR